MVMISPSRREVSSAEKLRQSPRLVPPRFRLVAAESRPESLLMIFFLNERLHQGAHEAGDAPRGVGRAPTLVARVWAPSGTFFAQYFLLIPKRASVKFQDFWSCAE